MTNEMPTPTETWCSPTETARIMTSPTAPVSAAKVREVARKGLFAHLGWTRCTEHGHYEVNTAAALQAPLWWAHLTGKNNRRAWGPAWTGSRLGHKAEVKAARRRARQLGKVQPAETIPLETVPAKIIKTP